MTCVTGPLRARSFATGTAAAEVWSDGRYARSVPGDGARVGILGGTFDPPHIGHLVTAVAVRQSLHLDEVLAVVANDPWQKTAAAPVTAAEARLAMVEAAVADLEGVVASDLEIRRGGPSYTIDTVRELERQRPGVELFLVVGADAAAGLSSWERADELAGLVTVVVVDRPGLDATPPPTGWRVVPVSVPRLDVSSTELRERAAGGRPLDVLTPPRVIDEIRRRRLYGWTRP